MHTLRNPSDFVAKSLQLNQQIKECRACHQFIGVLRRHILEKDAYRPGLKPSAERPHIRNGMCDSGSISYSPPLQVWVVRRTMGPDTCGPPLLPLVAEGGLGNGYVYAASPSATTSLQAARRCSSTARSRLAGLPVDAASVRPIWQTGYEPVSASCRYWLMDTAFDAGGSPNPKGPPVLLWHNLVLLPFIHSAAARKPRAASG
jgi:hypothetical protein